MRRRAAQQNSGTLGRLGWERGVGELQIRVYRPEDHDALVELWAEAFPNDPPRNAPAVMIRNKMRVQPELLLVAEDDGRLIGAVMAGDDGTRGWIHHLAVAQTHRRRRIGTALMRTAEAGLREMGCPKVNLQVRSSNVAVVAFYESIGYSVEPITSLGKMLGESP